MLKLVKFQNIRKLVSQLNSIETLERKIEKFIPLVILENYGWLFKGGGQGKHGPQYDTMRANIH